MHEFRISHCKFTEFLASAILHIDLFMHLLMNSIKGTRISELLLGDTCRKICIFEKVYVNIFLPNTGRTKSLSLFINIYSAQTTLIRQTFVLIHNKYFYKFYLLDHIPQ